jgi:hypothetical protein
MEQNRYRELVVSYAKVMDFIYRIKPKNATNFNYKQMKSLLGD